MELINGKGRVRGRAKELGEKMGWLEGTGFQRRARDPERSRGT